MIINKCCPYCGNIKKKKQCQINRIIISNIMFEEVAKKNDNNFNYTTTYISHNKVECCFKIVFFQENKYAINKITIKLIAEIEHNNLSDEIIISNIINPILAFVRKMLLSLTTHTVEANDGKY